MSVLRVPVTPADHIRGPENAPVTLVEYGDYECPFCGQAHPIVNRVRKHFGDDVNLVFRHFPMTKVHPHAQSAAETAELAGTHGRFWEMHDGLYANQDSLGLPLYITLATALGLSEQELLTALETGLYARKVRRDFMGGVRSGVNGTPTFFINGHRHDGPFEFATLVSAIDSALLEARKVGAI